MDASSPVTTWIVGDRFAHSDAARHSLLATIPTGLSTPITTGESVMRAIVPDCHTTRVCRSRLPVC
ncbi:MAG: hypothetical protein ABEJ57_05740 [Halobacteriaceae archaeon]